MLHVRMMVAAREKAKLNSEYLKMTTVAHDGNDRLECYHTSEGELVLEVHFNKTKVEDTKREIPRLEEQLRYQKNVIGRINKEMENGHMGRKGDLSGFEAKAHELEQEIRTANELVKSAKVEITKFYHEDCD